MDRKKAAVLMLATCFAALLIGWHFLSAGAPSSLSRDYSVSEAGLLEYGITLPAYTITPGKLEENSSFSEVRPSTADGKTPPSIR